MNFLTEFTKFAAGTEAPENYNIWTAVSTMSTIMSRKVWLQYGRFTIYANTYVVLLGPPGNGKTTSLNFGRKIIAAIPGIPAAAQAQTKESLVKELCATQQKFEYPGGQIQAAPMSIFITELSHFLGPNSGHMLDFLTTVYDLDIYDARTKNKGDNIAYGPYVTLLACTTPDWVSTYLKTDIITGGFTRRAIFVNETEAITRIPWPELSPEQTKAFENVIEIGKEKSKLIGEIVWSNMARKWFTEWYLDQKLPQDPTIRGYYRTLKVQLMKVAMVVSICERDDLILTDEHLQIALAMLDRIAGNLASVFRAVGRNELHAVGQKIVQLLDMNNGFMPKKEIIRAMSAHANSRELWEILTMLRDTDVVYEAKLDLGDGVPRDYILTPFAKKQIEERLALKQDEDRARVGVVSGT